MKFLYGLGVAALAVWVGVMYLPMIRQCRDVNSEAYNQVLVGGYLESARNAGADPIEYLDSPGFLRDYKQADPTSAYQGYGGTFIYRFQAYVCPFTQLLQVPFIRFGGVGPATVIAFSVFWFLLAIWATWFLGKVMFGPWVGLLAAWFLSACQISVLHCAVAYPNMSPTVALVAMLAAMSYRYLQTGKAWYLGAAGAYAGLVLLLGWVGPLAAAVLILAAGIIQFRVKRWAILSDWVWAFYGFLLSTMTVIVGFTTYFHSRLGDLLYGWLMPILFRGADTPIGGFHPGLQGKISYAVMCFFFDSRQLDHLDKCMPGYTALPLVFYLSLGLGIMYLLTREIVKSPRSLLLGTWILTGIIFCLTYIYAHRYVLPYLPALTVLSAAGVSRMSGEMSGYKRFCFLCPFVGWLALTSATMHHRFYDTYLQNRLYDFESSRFIGGYRIAQFVKSLDLASEKTLIVNGYPPIFPSENLLFYLYGQPYRYVVLPKELYGDGEDESVCRKVREWEKTQLQTYDRIVYILSTAVFTDTRTGAMMYDARSFMQENPIENARFVYHYFGHPLSTIVYVTEKGQK